MSVSPADHGFLHGLFGDEEIGAWLGAEAEIAAMIRFEAALAVASARLGIIPEAAGEAIAQALDGFAMSANGLATATASAGVPVPGLVAALRQAVPAPHGAFVHWGATSQDVVDTGLVLRLREIAALLDARLDALTTRLDDLAAREAETEMAARTRSQIATPTTFGLRIAGWCAPLKRCRERLAELSPRLLVLQLGGASGNLSVYGDQGIALMEELARELDLAVPAKPWHAERDGVVEFAGWLAMVSGLLGRIGGDLILMGRSEIGEAVAGAGGGSSTMPQKSNPVLAETLVSLARFNAAQSGLAQQALLHAEERDSTAWALEWMTLPGMCQATAAGLRHALALSEGLAARPDRMRAHLDLAGGAVHAEALAFALAEHMPLPEAQAIMKQAAKAVAAEGGTLQAQIAALCDARGIPAPQIDPAPMHRTARALIGRVAATGRPADRRDG